MQNTVAKVNYKRPSTFASLQTPIYAFANCKHFLVMNEHRFILEPYQGMNTRYHCPAPNCGKDKTFVRYIDTETGEHINPSVGRCNRENNCGYHYTPKQYFHNNNISYDTPQPIRYNQKFATPKPRSASFIPVDAFKASLNGHASNHFVKFLINLFGVEVTSELVSRYFIATSKLWNGATIFWQIDTKGQIHTGKIMLYSPTTGKRVKEPFNHIAWVHKALKKPEFELKQCLFGEHLLIDNPKPIALVESEKTAVIASVYLPQFIWLAVGSSTGLNVEKCNVLKGRTVALFPDLNVYKEWDTKRNELSHIATFTISDLLERKATDEERRQGLDIADYLIRFDPKEFRNNEQKKQPVLNLKSGSERIENREDTAEYAIKETHSLEVKKNRVVPQAEDIKFSETIEPNYIFRENATSKAESWDNDIKELEQFFSKTPLPEHPIKFDRCTTIINLSKFIDSHLDIVRAQNGKPTYRPYLDRLLIFKELIKNNLN